MARADGDARRLAQDTGRVSHILRADDGPQGQPDEQNEQDKQDELASYLLHPLAWQTGQTRRSTASENHAWLCAVAFSIATFSMKQQLVTKTLKNTALN